jgi:glycogen debranching enzyme
MPFLPPSRRLRPELFAIAELFSGSAELDANYVSKLGLNALIREAMQPGDSRELGRLIHRNSQIPIGSLRNNLKPSSAYVQE